MIPDKRKENKTVWQWSQYAEAEMFQCSFQQSGKEYKKIQENMQTVRNDSVFISWHFELLTRSITK